jgi:integrase
VRAPTRESHRRILTRWYRAREELGVPEVTTHSFRKTLATLIDDEGLTARIGAGLSHRPRSTRLTNPIPWRRRAEHAAKVSDPAQVSMTNP